MIRQASCSGRHLSGNFKAPHLSWQTFVQLLMSEDTWIQPVAATLYLDDGR